MFVTAAFSPPLVPAVAESDASRLAILSLSNWRGHTIHVDVRRYNIGEAVKRDATLNYLVPEGVRYDKYVHYVIAIILRHISQLCHGNVTVRAITLINALSLPPKKKFQEAA